jgi:hypothetical protein
VRGLVAQGVTALRLPLVHRVARAALLLGGRALVQLPDGPARRELWGVVELGAALLALAPELSARLAASRYAGWQGRVRVAGAFGDLVLRCDGAEVLPELSAGPADVTIDRLSLGALAQLLLGYRAAADLHATGELRCADVDLGLIDSLFPVL